MLPPLLSVSPPNHLSPPRSSLPATTFPISVPLSSISPTQPYAVLNSRPNFHPTIPKPKPTKGKNYAHCIARSTYVDHPPHALTLITNPDKSRIPRPEDNRVRRRAGHRRRKVEGGEKVFNNTGLDWTGCLISGLEVILGFTVTVIIGLRGKALNSENGWAR